MEYKYRYKIKASDIWQVRMYYAYASYLAVVNLTCIAASIILILTQWRTAGTVFKTLMLIFLSLFLIIQPLVIYLTSIPQAKANDEEMELVFNDAGMTIRTDGREERIGWSGIVSMTVRPTLIIIYTDANHGYILTNRVLKNTRKEFLEFAKANREKSRAKAH